MTKKNDRVFSSWFDDSVDNLNSFSLIHEKNRRAHGKKRHHVKFSSNLATGITYRSEGAVTSRTIHEIRWILVPACIQYILCIIVFFFLYTAMLSKIIGGESLVRIGLFGACIAALVFPVLTLILMQYQLYCIREQSGNGRAICRYRSIFDDNGIHVKNLSTGESENISYERIMRISETRHLFVFFPLFHRPVYMFKNGMDYAQQDEFRSFAIMMAFLADFYGLYRAKPYKNRIIYSSLKRRNRSSRNRESSADLQKMLSKIMQKRGETHMKKISKMEEITVEEALRRYENGEEILLNDGKVAGFVQA